MSEMNPGMPERNDETAEANQKTKCLIPYQPPIALDINWPPISAKQSPSKNTSKTAATPSTESKFTVPPTMTAIETLMLASPFPTSQPTYPSSSTSTSTNSTKRRCSLRERCGFSLALSFVPAFPNIPARGHIGPTAGNIPRRRRSSAVSLEPPAPRAAAVERDAYFAVV
ncbi:hypothetical protein B0H14DRAFT_2804602 [Mycena olivaceomarginata]|nr:hypothetical protein B0H14DRAFT_2804602 [Mycena olivaceomarginata]